MGLVGFAVAGLAALGACSDSVKATSDAGTDSGPGGGGDGGGPGTTGGDTINIGVTLGLTGDLAGFASGIQNAARVAESYINANGGVTNKKIRLVIEDDKTSKGDGSQLLTNIDKFLTTDKVAAILGPLGSGQVKSAHKKARDAKVIQLSPSATSPDLGGVGAGNEDFAGDTKSRFFFRTCPPDDFQGVAVATFAYAGPNGGSGGDAGAVGCRKLAIVHIDDAYGKTLKDVVKAQWAKKSGATVVYEKEVPTEGPNFTTADSVAADVANAGADCQAVVMYETVAGKYMKAVKANAALNAKANFFTVGTDGIFTDGFLKEARSNPTEETSDNYAKGVYGTNPDTNPDTADFKAFEQLYKTQFPASGSQEVPAFASNMFDAALLVSLAIQKAGGTSDPSKVRDMLVEVSRGKAAGATKVRLSDFATAMQSAKEGKDINYEGASGPVDFKEDGSIAAGMIIWRVDQTAGQAPGYKTIQRITTDQLNQ